MVECQLPKLDVAGSIPVARSLPKPPADGGFVVSGGVPRPASGRRALDRNVRTDICGRGVEVGQADRLAGGGDQTPPLSGEARIEAGFLLRRLQRGEGLGLPYSRPIPSIGARCHELRITDRDQTWRIIYRADADAIVIVEVFSKKTRATPRLVIENATRRLAAYDELA